MTMIEVMVLEAVGQVMFRSLVVAVLSQYLRHILQTCFADELLG